MSYYRVPVIGAGTRRNPYRPEVAGLVQHWVAHIPSDPNGAPRFTTCYIWVPQGVIVPQVFDVFLQDRNTARSDIRNRDSRANPDDMEATR